MKYRVCYRPTARADWHVQEFTDRASAYAFKAAKRAQLWAAMVQTWHASEQRWIG